MPDAAFLAELLPGCRLGVTALGALGSIHPGTYMCASWFVCGSHAIHDPHTAPSKVCVAGFAVRIPLRCCPQAPAQKLLLVTACSALNAVVQMAKLSPSSTMQSQSCKACRDPALTAHGLMLLMMPQGLLSWPNR